MPQFWHMEDGNNNNIHFIVLLMWLSKVSQSLIMVSPCSRYVINGNTDNDSYYIEVIYNHIIIMLRCAYLHFSGDEVTWLSSCVNPCYFHCKLVKSNVFFHFNICSICIRQNTEVEVSSNHENVVLSWRQDVNNFHLFIHPLLFLINYWRISIIHLYYLSP